MSRDVTPIGGLWRYMICVTLTPRKARPHPVNKVADVLNVFQSVPAELKAVRDFLDALFRQRDWMPGKLALNPKLDHLDDRAKQIVDLIKPPSGPGVKFCCGPHMEVAFDDAREVAGWEQLAAGRVIDSNMECLQLFGMAVAKDSFGDWIGTENAESEWVQELVRAISSIGEGKAVPVISSSFCLESGQRIQPKICAVRRRMSDQSVESIDMLFTKVDLLPMTTTMKPELAALSVTLDFAVRFRYQVLEPFAHRPLERSDVVQFDRTLSALTIQVMRERSGIRMERKDFRAKTLKLFEGEDRDVIQEMYDRSDKLWRSDGQGEMDRALQGDGTELEPLIVELLEMNQGFLTVTAKRFAELIAAP